MREDFENTVRARIWNLPGRGLNSACPVTRFRLRFPRCIRWSTLPLASGARFQAMVRLWQRAVSRRHCKWKLVFARTRRNFYQRCGYIDRD